LLPVRKKELGAACEASDVCRDDNAFCVIISGSAGSNVADRSTCQCRDTFYQTAQGVCSKYLQIIWAKLTWHATGSLLFLT